MSGNIVVYENNIKSYQNDISISGHTLFRGLDRHNEYDLIGLLVDTYRRIDSEDRASQVMKLLAKKEIALFLTAVADGMEYPSSTVDYLREELRWLDEEIKHEVEDVRHLGLVLKGEPKKPRTYYVMEDVIEQGYRLPRGEGRKIREKVLRNPDLRVYVRPIQTIKGERNGIRTDNIPDFLRKLQNAYEIEAQRKQIEESQMSILFNGNVLEAPKD